MTNSMITPEAKKEYIEGKGTHCPFCGSIRITGVSSFDVLSTDAIQRVECSACGEDWYDVYKLYDIYEIENAWRK